MKVIALTGPPCSGKGTVKDMIFEICAQRGLAARYLGFSDEIKREALARDMRLSEVDRDDMTRLVAAMRAAEGPGLLAERIVQRIAEAPADVYVVEAVRHPAEADILREAYGDDFSLVAVTAEVRTMAERLLARPRSDESRAAKQSLQVAEQLIRREMDGDDDAGVHVGRCIQMADITVENNGTLDDLRRTVHEQLGALVPSARQQ